MNEPKLEVPGAGIPFIHRIAAKYFILPKVFKKSWSEANTLYQKQLDGILEMALSIPEYKRNQRVLVQPIQGLEDSSRYWSTQMVLEHICIVSEGIGSAIVSLSHNEQPKRTANTAEYKPLGEEALELTMQKFENMALHHVQEINSKVKDPQSSLKFKHPWFVGLTAHEWNWMLGIHAKVHRNQLKVIKAAL